MPMLNLPTLIEFRMTSMELRVFHFLSNTGYSGSDIQTGIEYARERGYETEVELGSFTLSRILLDDSQLNDGGLIGWEPLDEQ